MHPTRRRSCVHQAALLTAALALALAPGSRDAPLAQAVPMPEQVVLAYAEAWSNGDLPALLALLADDARIYQRPTDPHRLTGELSEAIGSKDKLATYFRKLSANQALAREQVSEMAGVGDVIIAAGESATPPAYASGMQFLTGYRVRDGRIHDVWHIAWIRADTPLAVDGTNVIRRLIAAKNARDADRFLALFSPAAKYFRYSGDPHKLADNPSGTPTDADSREEFFLKYFAGTPENIEAVKLFSVGDLVVEQSQVTGFADAPDKIVNEISIYRIRGGRIVDHWLVGEETLATVAP